MFPPERATSSFRGVAHGEEAVYVVVRAEAIRQAAKRSYPFRTDPAKCMGTESLQCGAKSKKKQVPIAQPSIGVGRFKPHLTSLGEPEGEPVMSKEDEVRKASKSFYAGLNRMINGDAAPLADVWSHSESVTALHPIGGRQVGWSAVRESFEQLARLSADGKVALKDQLIRVAGDVAFEAGVEQGHFTLAGERVTIEHRVTNIYQREAGAWKMTHHHTDTSPGMQDVLGRLESRPAKTGTDR